STRTTPAAPGRSATRVVRVAPYLGRRPPRALWARAAAGRGRGPAPRRAAGGVPPRLGARDTQLPPLDRPARRTRLPGVHPRAARLRRHPRPAAPALLARGLRRLGRRVPRGRRRGRGGVPRRALLRRRRR